MRKGASDSRAVILARISASGLVGAGGASGVGFSGWVAAQDPTYSFGGSSSVAIMANAACLWGVLLASEIFPPRRVAIGMLWALPYPWNIGPLQTGHFGRAFVRRMRAAVGHSDFRSTACFRR